MALGALPRKQPVFAHPPPPPLAGPDLLLQARSPRFSCPQSLSQASLGIATSPLMGAVDRLASPPPSRPRPCWTPVPIRRPCQISLLNLHPWQPSCSNKIAVKVSSPAPSPGLASLWPLYISHRKARRDHCPKTLTSPPIQAAPDSLQSTCQSNGYLKILPTEPETGTGSGSNNPNFTKLSTRLPSIRIHLRIPQRPQPFQVSYLPPLLLTVLRRLHHSYI